MDGYLKLQQQPNVVVISFLKLRILIDQITENLKHRSDTLLGCKYIGIIKLVFVASFQFLKS